MDDINQSAASSSPTTPSIDQQLQLSTNASVPSPGAEPAQVHELTNSPTRAMDVDEMYPDSENDEEAEPSKRRRLNLEEELRKAEKGEQEEELEAWNCHPLSLEGEMLKAENGDHEEETECSNRHSLNLQEEMLKAGKGDHEEARAEVKGGEVAQGSHTSMENTVESNSTLADTTDERQHTTAARVGATNGHGERLATVKTWLAIHWLGCAIFAPVCFFAALFASSYLCRPLYSHSLSNGRTALEGPTFCRYIEWASPFGSKATHNGENIDPVRRLPAPVFPDDPAAHMTSLRSILTLLPPSHISARLERDLRHRLRAAETALAHGDMKRIAPPSTTTATISTTSFSSSCHQTIYSLPLDIAVLTSPASCTVGMDICAVRELYISNEALTQAFSDLLEVETRFAGQAEVSQWVQKWNASVRGCLRGLVARRYHR
ncbi:hypothetical protein BST61_g11470 [Cercospora zeina]